MLRRADEALELERRGVARGPTTKQQQNVDIYSVYIIYIYIYFFFVCIYIYMYVCIYIYIACIEFGRLGCA